MNHPVEHTVLAYLGHFTIILCFVSALLLMISAYKQGKEGLGSSWSSFTKNIFYFHAFCTLFSIGLLFHLLASHYFEFNYVWKYTSRDMAPKYLFAAFWSGQEGSFLLWSFWIIVFTFIIIRKKTEWTPFVIFTIALFQVVLYSMLLGVFIGDIRIGSDPFILVRELPENAMMPWTKMPDYMIRIGEFQDGKGLNPLLQNYWMTIHPPILFMGFASCLIPFAFAVAGAWRKKYTEWIGPAMPWTVFGVGALGCGILLGGVWAYEALSFGGFWAWDPVENSSLVPWIMLVAGLHVMMITQAKKKSIFSSYLFPCLSFIAVMYSTFLTRSGILGESSVHSFSENEIIVQLFVPVGLFIIYPLHFLLKSKMQQWILWSLPILFLLLALWLDQVGLFSGIFILFIVLGTAYAANQFKTEEEHLSSKEFWMFIGVLVFLIAALQIIFTTSIPVINRLAGSNFDAFTEIATRNQFYARWQVPFALFVVLASGIVSFLKFGESKINPLLKTLWKPIAIGTLLFVVFLVFNSYLLDNWMFTAFLLACSWGLAINIHFIVLSGQKHRISGGSIAHVGFIFIMLGSLFSGAGKTPISANSSKFDVEKLSEDLNNEGNILMQKDDTIRMAPYFVSYKGKTQEGVNIYYNVEYYEDVEDKPGDLLFTIQPFVQLNEKFGNVPEPGTKNFLSHDVFTYVKWADLSPVDANSDPDYMTESKITITLDQPISFENWKLTLTEIVVLEDEFVAQSDLYQEGDIVLHTTLKIEEQFENGITEDVKTELIIRNNSEIISEEVLNEKLNIKLQLHKLSDKPNTIVYMFKEREYIVMEALVFPMIKFTWAGCILLVLGSWMALFNRINKPTKF